MSFVKNSHTYLLQGIKANHPTIMSSHHIENLLKKGHVNIITQLHVLQLCETSSLDTPSEMQQVLDTYNLEVNLPIGLPPSHWEHDHNIPLILGI